MTLSSDLSDVAHLFPTPPNDSRIMMRWWWFGPAVVKPELQREILAMKAGGIGGFEIQPVYPLALDDPAKGFRNLPYLSKDFLDAVTFASDTARENNMRVDMTLASGWPYGGSHVPVTLASSRLRQVVTDVAPSETSVALPSIGNGEALITMFVGPGSSKSYDISGLKQVPVHEEHGRTMLDAAAENRVAVFYISSRTGQQVKRAAVGANGFVLDHMDKAAIDDHLRVVGEKLMQAFGDHPPYAVFSDSLEVYGADWTGDLIPEFQKRRGYDLTPHLPELFKGDSEECFEVRRDWAKTLTELVDERYLTPINNWAIKHHTRFRSQTYGLPPVSLSSNNLVALPEGEGPQWRSFSFTRWATSASHLYGRPITSAETWTWLHSPAFRATPLDMKAEADRFFIEGVNQLIGHGWPYSPPGVAEPGWEFYAAAVFNDHNPWWIVMPDITKYLQRMSYLLRQGKPDNDIAVLLPNDDAYARLKPGMVTLSGEMSHYVTPELMGQILDSGFNVDYIDGEAIEKVGIQHPVLVLPHVERLSPDVLEKIIEYAQHGGKVIAVGTTPSKSPGMENAKEISEKVSALSQQLFQGANAGGRLVSSDTDLGAALKAALTPDVVVSDDASDIGFIHRKLTDGEIYFVVNTSNHDIHATVKFRDTAKSAAMWDPFSGVEMPVDATPLHMDLAPYQSRVIVFGDHVAGKPASAEFPSRHQVADLSTDWNLSFPSLHINRTLSKLDSWTDAPDTQYFSGEAVYTKDIKITAGELKRSSLVLDFGQGTTLEDNPKKHNGTRALLESPIREAAVVLVNGQRVGSVWHPPYTLDITAQVHPGQNHIEVRVANLAINEWSGRSLDDYHLLNLEYGERFVPQDVENMKPLPAGMMGPVKLFAEKK